jgi:hypothetical protein
MSTGLDSVQDRPAGHSDVTGQLGAADRPVFVLCTGRSGSTLLLRYVNTLSRVTVWGEHAGLVSELMQAEQRLAEPKIWTMIEQQRGHVPAMIDKSLPITLAGRGTSIEWANPFELADVQDAARTYLKRLLASGLPQERRWGFKEIRYGTDEVNYLRRLFPAAQFILQTRDPEAVLRSQFKHFAKGDSSKLVNRLRNITHYFESAAELLALGLPKVFMLSRFDDLALNGLQEARRLAAFLDEPMDEAAAAMIAAERGGDDPARGVSAASLGQRLKAFATQQGVDLPAPLVARCCKAYAAVNAAHHAHLVNPAHGNLACV